MRALAAAALLLASCYEPGGQCTVDTDCLTDQICGVDALCVPGTRPPPGPAIAAGADAFSFTVPGPFDVAASQGVLKNDSDPADPSGRSLSAELVENATYGQVFLQPDGAFTYAPFLGFTGADAFTYRATNGTRVSDVTSVSITVAP
jgi:hypothetical protein